MNEFFSSIYSWFCDSSMTVFKIMDTIWSGDEELLLSSSFPTIGIIAAVISFLVAFAFYIWPINHPRFKAWWAWLLMLIVDAAINFGLTFAFIQHRISDIEKIGEDALDNLPDVTDEETLSIPFGQWFDLAMSNVCVSVLFFILASLILNWFSTNCRFSPFRK